jgi:hypothetical protein
MLKRITLKQAFRWTLTTLMTLFVGSSAAYSAMHFTLGGSKSSANAGLQQIDEGALSGSVAVDLGSYLRLSYTHRQELSSTTGYSYDDETKEYSYARSTTHQIANSVDLIIILYAGELFTPYVFGGVVHKQYIMQTETKDGVQTAKMAVPAPNGGAGVGIRLSQKFSLKISYTASPGVRQEPNREPERTIDTYAQLGITYSL